MSYFASICSQYYTRQGNRIIFTNGMHLNQLADEMSGYLDFAFDSSALSRIIHGTRHISHKQLQIFCTVLGLSGSDHNRLLRAAARDCLKRAGCCDEVVQKKHAYTRLLEMMLEDYGNNAPPHDVSADDLRFPRDVLSCLMDPEALRSNIVPVYVSGGSLSSRWHILSS